MTRTETIAALLERYDDLVNPSGPSTGAAGIPLPPRTYDDNVRELERLLRLMRDDRHQPLLRIGERKVSLRACWWHVNERYIAAVHVIRVEPRRVKRKNGKHIVIHERRVATLKNGSEDAIVQLGITWMAGAWALEHEPMLPEQAMVAA